MRRSVWERIREILKKHVIHGKWVRAVISLACVVIFITTYVLIMPAVTLSRAADCGQEEHTHTEDCYETESELTCGQEEHTPTEDCYDEKGSLICGPELAYVDDSTFTFKISDLPKNGMIGSDEGEYTYFVTEDTVSGYRDASYSNPSVSSDGGEVSWILSDEYALNNGKIINKPENSVELPHTGGPGTRALTILGVMLIALAGAGLVLRKRRREAAQGIKHL